MSSISSTPPIGGGGSTISAVHPDIIRAHILTRLDGPALVAAACASPELHALSSEDKLWRDICASTWPSTDDPRVRHVISTFPSGHRSFFSDSFPLLDHHHRRCSPPPTRGLISSVDIFYEDKLVFSRVHEIETETECFMHSPFRIDLLAQNETAPVPIRHGGLEEEWLRMVEEKLTLSWIVIDPAMKRAGNVSSRSPVSVSRHWLTGDVQVRFGAIMASGRSDEKVECGVVVTCGGKEGGEMGMSELSMQVEGMDGRILNGKDSLVILQGAIGFGKRKKQQGQDGKRSFEEYEELKVTRRRRIQRIERALDLGCVVTGVTTFITFWCFILFR